MLTISPQKVADTPALRFFPGVADETYPHHKKYRVSGYPKDSFHIACIAHRTRLQNIIRSPGIDLIEKSLLKQHLANLTAAQSGYIEKQKKAVQVKN